MAHWAFRRLSSTLAKEGFHVLRFDWSGTGDSWGRTADGTMDQRVDDVTLGVQELRDASGAESVSVVGLRLGDAIAAILRHDSPRRRPALREPAICGASHIAQLESLDARENTRLLHRVPPSCDELGDFPFPERVRVGDSEVRPPAVPPRGVKRAAIVVGAEPWDAPISSAPSTRPRSRPPFTAPSRTSRPLTRASERRRPREPEPRHHHRAPRGRGARPGGFAIERALAFGRDAGLAGVLAEPNPPDAVAGAPAIVMWNVGIQHRIRPHRIQVDIARDLARRGRRRRPRFDLGNGRQRGPARHPARPGARARRRERGARLVLEEVRAATFFAPIYFARASTRCAARPRRQPASLARASSRSAHPADGGLLLRHPDGCSIRSGGDGTSPTAHRRPRCSTGAPPRSARTGRSPRA